MPEDFRGAHTTEYQAVRTRIRNEGVLQVPVADGSEEAEIVQFCDPTESLMIQWTATKVGAPPTMPSPEFFEPNLKLIHQEVGAMLPMPHVTGGHAWSCSGAYLYALKKPNPVVSSLPTGKLPFDDGTAGANTIPASKFSRDVLGTGLQNPL